MNFNVMHKLFTNLNPNLALEKSYYAAEVRRYRTSLYPHGIFNTPTPESFPYQEEEKDEDSYLFKNLPISTLSWIHDQDDTHACNYCTFLHNDCNLQLRLYCGLASVAFSSTILYKKNVCKHAGRLTGKEQINKERKSFTVQTVFFLF